MTKMLQKFKFQSKTGKFLDITDWISTLSQDEQTEYWQSRKQQDFYRQQSIDNRDMIWTDAGYEWLDEKTAKKGKESDPVWEKYFNRWLQECDIDFIMTWEEIK